MYNAIFTHLSSPQHYIKTFEFLSSKAFKNVACHSCASVSSWVMPSFITNIEFWFYFKSRKIMLVGPRNIEWNESGLLSVCWVLHAGLVLSSHQAWLKPPWASRQPIFLWHFWLLLNRFECSGGPQSHDLMTWRLILSVILSWLMCNKIQLCNRKI